jgi:hypothetical protein
MLHALAALGGIGNRGCADRDKVGHRRPSLRSLARTCLFSRVISERVSGRQWPPMRWPLAATRLRAQEPRGFPFTDIIYGVWQSDDGGKYHCGRSAGTFGGSASARITARRSLTSSIGQVHGNQITGGWLDVPNWMERRTNAGQVTIRIDNPQQPTKLTKLKSPTGPGAHTWTRIFDCPDTNTVGR